MTIYTAIEKYLTTVVSQFKAEAKRTHLIAEQGTFLDGRDMEMLAKANARGIAAQSVLNLINLHLTHNVTHSKAAGKTEEEGQKEALPRIIRAVQDKMDIALRSENPPHIATIVVFNEVLDALRREEAGF